MEITDKTGAFGLLFFMKKVSEKQKERNKGKAERTSSLHALFKQIWDEREGIEGECYCFESGVRMDGSRYRGNTCCYDHVLEKSKWPQYEFTRANIIIVHPDIHNKKGSNIDSVPAIKEYREHLLSLHYKNEL